MKSVRLFSVVLLMCLGQFVNAQIIVKVKPVAPRHATLVVRPNACPKGHVWIAGGWIPRGNTYVWKDGYYAKHRPGYVYVEGFWKRNRHGWVWVPGKWKRVR